MEEVKKSVNPRVYKSASVRNLPVPVQSVLQPASIHTMDSEGDPFESPEERAYNRVISELADTKLDCSSRLEGLEREASRLASILSGNTGGDGDSEGASVLSNKTVASTPGNETQASGNKTSLTSFLSDLLNTTSADGSGRACECPVCPEPPLPKECDPCSESPSDVPGGTAPDVCGPHPPIVTSPGSYSDVVEVPMAFLVGVATTLLMLVLAVVIGVIIRYIPIILSGVFVLCLMCVVGYCSSKYPESARRLGTRVWEALRSGVSAVVERLFRRNHPEVSVN